MEDAHNAFEEMDERNVISWNTTSKVVLAPKHFDVFH
jgi:hypothetical protein